MTASAPSEIDQDLHDGLPIAVQVSGASGAVTGTVEDPGGGGTYGTLTANGPNTLSLELSWNQVNDVVPINAPPGGVQRTFSVKVADASGVTGHAEVAVWFICMAETAAFDPPSPSSAICAGECTNLKSILHCGTCALDCFAWEGRLPPPSNPYMQRPPLACSIASDGTGKCVMEQGASGGITCADACAAAGTTCTVVDANALQPSLDDQSKGQYGCENVSLAGCKYPSAGGSQPISSCSSQAYGDVTCMCE